MLNSRTSARGLEPRGRSWLSLCAIRPLLFQCHLREIVQTAAPGKTITPVLAFSFVALTFAQALKPFCAHMQLLEVFFFKGNCELLSGDEWFVTVRLAQRLWKRGPPSEARLHIKRHTYTCPIVLYPNKRKGTAGMLRKKTFTGSSSLFRYNCVCLVFSHRPLSSAFGVVLQNRRVVCHRLANAQDQASERGT